ncbi:hypothetical protein CLIB1444_05S01200 [[Candida] jaroonii]|uniref:Uncharacterized protein n=1 Tax=[Candida] jaroonii TaxID=467808 RepID=A0ACA9Y7K5_9ASCO|nr:hypothetical protein CLIB1444_05S01200 [[Candida] jaroonii]
MEDINERQKRIALLRAQRKAGNKPQVTKEEPKQANTESDVPETIPTPNEINVMKLSGNETVELVSKDIENRIFARSKEVADNAIEFENLEVEKKPTYNQDLKDSMKREFEIAQQRTNKVINQILQEKYTTKND